MIESIIGSLVGIGGGLVTAVAGHFTQKMKNKHDVAMGDLELQKMDKDHLHMVAEADATLKITESINDGKLDVLDAEIAKSSIENQGKDSLSEEVLSKLLTSTSRFARCAGVVLSVLLGFSDFLKKLIRPCLTIYFVGVTTWITVLSWDIMQAHQTTITDDQAVQLFNRVIDISIHLTVTCVTWWFADRRMAKHLMRMNDGNSKK